MLKLASEAISQIQAEAAAIVGGLWLVGLLGGLEMEQMGGFLRERA